MSFSLFVELKAISLHRFVFIHPQRPASSPVIFSEASRVYARVGFQSENEAKKRSFSEAEAKRKEVDICLRFGTAHSACLADESGDLLFAFERKSNLWGSDGRAALRSTLWKSKPEAWTAKARCPQGQVEKLRSLENRALEDPGQQNKQPQPLATWHAQRKHHFFLIEFPLDLERVAPFPAGSYGENPWKVATEARTKLITLCKKSKKKRSAIEKPKSCAAPSIQARPSWTAWKNLSENVQNQKETKFERRCAEIC